MTDPWQAYYSQYVVEAAEGSRVLAKAQEDTFIFACRLKTGEAFTFEHAEVEKNWVHFQGLRHLEGFPEPQRQASPEIERGLDVQKDTIAWIMDGS
jgi:hypothetical protein